MVEQRLVHIAEELRCLVCQNESLAGSRADLALDLKREIRQLIKQGKTDQEVRDFLVTRYGDYVLYRPPVKPTTWLLWGGPFVLLAAGLAGLIVFLRKRRPAEAALSPEDQRRAEALLKGDS
ncbi:MAG: cytochrome c-type biogenesis protein CcmH [Rhizobacter sp.]